MRISKSVKVDGEPVRSRSWFAHMRDLKCTLLVKGKEETLEIFERF